MPLLETKGAGSAQGFGLSLGGEEAVYIEDVFSTYLYTGTGASQTITNNIDLAGEGGLVWIKLRSTSLGFTFAHALFDTERGVNQFIRSDGQTANTTYNNSLTAFNSNGFSLGTDPSTGLVNYGTGTNTYASWTFRKQPKFFDVVTYTGDGSANKAISHNLGSTPGAIIVKSTSATGDWPVLHRSLTAGNSLYLNSTVAQGANADWGNPYTAPTSTTFNVSYGNTNTNGVTYVAYLFAHNAGGFGLTGTDNVISCGSFTTTAGGLLTAPINLGYEPQWVMYKRTNGTSDWSIVDTMRGFTVESSGIDRALLANLSNAEANAGLAAPSATGIVNDDGTNGFFGSSTYIYIAIRRGPMKVPTSGTEVFTPIARTGTGATATVTGTGFPVDMLWSFSRTPTVGVAAGIRDRLRGVNKIMVSERTTAETSINETTGVLSFTMDGMTVGADAEWETVNKSGNSYINWFFRRAPGFFDEVCFTGPASGSTTQSHNLAAVPELIIAKCRSVGSYWYVYAATAGINKWLALNLSDAETTSSNFWVTAPTSTAFTCSITATGFSGGNVAYLFATLAGVSKVGSYTGTGTTQVINCGFTAGARFVLIKKTSGTGSWYVWDSARGIVSGNDPYLLLNSTAAEVTNTDYIDAYSAGFEISSTAPSEINENGGSFIFLAIS